ncbi:hypothetical protein M0M57_06380 [Flavobacterium azooxidireducens]|uniref:Uncharacterized protein n=1 Tax=Flavobacterium azooxidireducens TaxID=1871076 RepID=A0ABY4KI49_9FLAO|nr:hypothetical protein [Flavobacterium azooxidireducens]UPQ80461.1 hypothetical protein M0M57_06380 [Flavobacterium azooxidireducens]
MKKQNNGHSDMVLGSKINFFLGFLLLIIVIVLVFKFSNGNNLKDSCLNEQYIPIESLSVGAEFDFKKVFNCKPWDYIIVIDKVNLINRINIFFKTGKILPNYEYEEYPDHTYFLFFFDNGSIISKPIHFGSPNFIFVEGFNSNFMKIEKENSIFINTPYKTTDFDLFTFESKNKTE